MEAAKENHHVVMFPWLAFGHLLPFLELSKSLASKDIQISFVSTPRNIQRLPVLPPNLKNHINLISIDLPSVDNLPGGSEVTADLELEQVQYLKKAYDELQTPFEMLLNQIKPDLIIFDFIACWIPELAGKLNMPSASFSVFSAAPLSFLGPTSKLKPDTQRSTPEQFTVVPYWIPFPSTVTYRLHEAIPACEVLSFPDITGKSTGDRFAKAFESCDFILVRSCEEYEGEYLHLLTDLYQKPVYPTGLLPPQCFAKRVCSSTDESRSVMFSWLNKQAPKSVVFVGFGSEYKMSIDEIHELALGVELSELPFLWVLRKPENMDSSDLLPLGFEDRITNRGFMCLGWVSQVEILAHPAIGGCLFHSGWGTIIESLSYGHAQILMPMIVDQGLNARLSVEKGFGFEVERNEDGSFTRGAVAKSMRTVMVDQAGEQLRLKAAQMREIFSNQVLHEDYINKFISALGQL